MTRRRRTAAAAAGALLLLAGAWWAAPPLARSVPRDGAESPEDAARPGPATPLPPRAVAWEAALPHDSIGWEEAAVLVVLDLHRTLAGRASGGSYEEARAEAARLDLAAHPPEPGRLRRLLLSDRPTERALALAALAARPVATDDVARIVLRSARPDDDETLRLLAAEVVAALPAELLARHEEDLLRAFAREPNPLVLAVALPALERLEAERLRILVDAQLSLAAPEMVPVWVALARDRLGAASLREAGVTVSARDADAPAGGPAEAGAGGGE